jgi:hypothetical protein
MAAPDFEILEAKTFVRFLSKFESLQTRRSLRASTSRHQQIEKVSAQLASDSIPWRTEASKSALQVVLNTK